MDSNGIKLMLVNNEHYLNICHNIILGLSLSIMGIYFLSLFFHKMVGVELMHTFQVIYLVHLINNDYTSPYSLLKYFAVITFDFLNQSNNFTNITTASGNITFSN
jgi:hypothetical protein